MGYVWLKTNEYTYEGKHTLCTHCPELIGVSDSVRMVNTFTCPWSGCLAPPLHTPPFMLV